MLNVKVGDEVCLAEAGRNKRIATVEHVTPSGRFRAGGVEFDAEGRERGAKGRWSSRTFASIPTDYDRWDIWQRNAIARLLNLHGVADKLSDDQLQRIIAILDEKKETP